MLFHGKRHRRELDKSAMESFLKLRKRGKGGHFTFSWGARLEYHSARKFEFESVWQETPMRTGHKGGLLKRFLSFTKNGV
jgi:hypothetical protein